ncbi:lipid asymmetry maintenance protein MlaB [Roseateles sp. BYS78W]|uniref:Lipid asymmetry maintenance protein MlaB n=1 Tax=Pelomonas candidula TaxID=3299025 RepID=A0ABW7HGZ5_9BURK
MDALPLPSELSIYSAAELHPQWLAWAGDAASAGTEALADGQGVDQVDGAGVQLLLALQRCLAARGCTLRLRAPSLPLREACAALGLATWLGDLQTPSPAEAA